MTTIETAGQYREAIRAALEGNDPALIQDALYDVDEFLRSERAAGGEELTERELARRALESFGAPGEVAASYLETDLQVARALGSPSVSHGTAGSSAGERLGTAVFGVLVDPRAYGALFLMMISLVTGILYFTWAAIGISLSLGFAILIIGIPFVILFAASLRMLGLMEGRLIEGLLGVRMPRRPPVGPTETGWLARVKYWLTDRRTWTTLLYLILALPLGVFSFTVATVLLSLSLAFVVTPFAQLFSETPIIRLGGFEWSPVWWTFPLFWLIGFGFQLALMHLARGFGHLRAGLARALLVG